MNKKLQVTMAKKLADKKDIKQGDSGSFEEREDCIVLRKSSGSTREADYEIAKAAIEEFLKDVSSLKESFRRSRRA